MNFAQAPARRRAENIVPMINVVFLLLIFFLMSAQITPPDPAEITPPDVLEASEAAGTAALFVDGQAQVYYDGQIGDAALAALTLRDAPEALEIRADRALPAQDLAALLPQLAERGISNTVLIVRGQ